MKKLLVPLAVILLLAFAVPAAFAELELGMSWTPITDPNSISGNATQNVPGFHVGYGWFILYASWDALAMPNFWVEQAAAYTDPSTGAVTPGPSVPGFLNLYDVGIRLILQPLEIYALVGTNNLKVYQDTHDYGYGANIRLGAGLKFGFWGINVSGTNVYGSWDDMVAVLKGLGSDTTRSWSLKQITDGLVPSVNLTFYF
jgi:hypothetical protein